MPIAADVEELPTEVWDSLGEWADFARLSIEKLPAAERVKLAGLGQLLLDLAGQDPPIDPLPLAVFCGVIAGGAAATSIRQDSRPEAPSLEMLLGLVNGGFRHGYEKTLAGHGPLDG